MRKMYYDGNDIFDLFELCMEYPEMKWPVLLPMVDKLREGESLLLGYDILVECVVNSRGATIHRS